MDWNVIKILAIFVVMLVATGWFFYNKGKQDNQLCDNSLAMHKSFEVALTLELLDKDSKMEGKSEMEKTALAITVTEVKLATFQKEFKKFCKRKTDPETD